MRAQYGNYGIILQSLRHISWNWFTGRGKELSVCDFTEFSSDIDESKPP